MNPRSNKVAFSLLTIYLIVFSVCAISPYDRAVWWAENIPVFIVVIGIILMSRSVDFSSTSLILMSVFIILHTIGGHYTFERVPFSFITDTFGFERNHYDRVAHFSVGLYAYAIAEVLMLKKLVRTRWLILLFPIFSIVTVAGGYEVIEWLYALNADPEAGLAVLGSQGDIWDAQKDILADTLGAILAMMLFFIHHNKNLQEFKKS